MVSPSAAGPTEATSSAPVEAPPSAPPPTETPLQLALPGEARLVLHAFVHVDAVLWDESSLDALDPSTGRPLNDTRVLIRRARLRAELQHPLLSGRLELDGNTVDGPVARLLAAEVTLRDPWSVGAPVPWVAATLGLMKIPFGAATPERVDERLFLEAPTFVRAYSPGEYDLGLAIHGGWRALRYVVALMNGDPVGERGLGGLDLNARKDILGRLGIDLPLGPTTRLEAGASALIGEGLSPGRPTTKDELVWRDVNENGLVELTELQVIAGAAAVAPQSFERFALGADVRLSLELPYAGPTVLFAEVTWAANLDRGLYVADPVAAGRDLRELGWTAGIYGQPWTWLRWGVRYDRYDPDADAADALGGVRVPTDTTLSSLAVVLEWRPTTLGHLALGYEHRDNALGRGVDGAPARLPDDSLTVRAAVGL